MTTHVQPGLSGVVAFETEIAEPDREGGRLLYRGVDVESLIGTVSFGDVWGLLVDGDFESPLLPVAAQTLPLHTGDHRIDLQAAISVLAATDRLRPLVDIDDPSARTDLATVSAQTISLAAQSARGTEKPAVPAHRIGEASTITERFMVEWQGEPDPQHVRALDTYWITAAEHGMNASTFTARVVASTGADVAASLSAAVGALSGPLHGGAPSRALAMTAEVERTGNARRYVRGVLDRGERLMGFGHAIYRAEDPRARILRAAAEELGAPRYEAALAVEEAALSELRERRPDRVLATNVEFWAAVVLDFAGIPDELLTPMFTCARLAGWSAHILEQKRLHKIIRPSALYVGRTDVAPQSLSGWGPA